VGLEENAMSLSPTEAAESLNEIEKTGRRSAEAHEYAAASAGFILWGLIWMALVGGGSLILVGLWLKKV
jgi:hypothetical protein